MQMVDTKELPQRARYYQSICDGVALSKGDFYTRLKEQYIIFLCPIDVFGHNFPCYHFENRAREDSSITLNDLTFKNFYIFTRYKEFTDPVVKAYMKYFATKNADTHETRTINDQVSFYKDDTLIRSKYMTYEFDLHESKEEGRAEGKIEGKAEGKLEMVDAMFEKTKLTDEEISSISGIPLEEIQKRRTQHQK
jgi:predicted transposase/invertase (TIGR01784 family)